MSLERFRVQQQIREEPMATILLSDEEYNHIQSLVKDLTGKVENASPRAATHYTAVAKMHADFIAKEDGKRATKKAKESTRDTIEKAKEARKNAAAASKQGVTQATNARPNSKSA